jgi:tRNA threonylcarbamoyladenosine biosynthesis protein TsaB
MLLLAADTSGKDGSIALARGDIGGTCKTIETVRLDGGGFSAQLVPKIADLLSRQGFSKKDIGGFAVASGPGSFTGLRVGLAAIKALAEVLSKPIASVSLLEAIAVTSGFEGNVIAAMDAGRQQLYVGEYDVSVNSARRIQESLVTQDEFAQMVCNAHVATPVSEIAALAQSAGAQARIVDAPDVDSIAVLGWKKIVAGETVLPEDLEANYIARPNAEIMAKSGS